MTVHANENPEPPHPIEQAIKAIDYQLALNEQHKLRGNARMIPQVVADVRDILRKHFKLDSETALKIAWALYEAKHLNDV